MKMGQQRNEKAPANVMFRGTYISGYASLMDNLVDVISRDARLCSCGGDIQNFTGKLAALAHRFLALGIEYLDLVAVHERATVLGVAVFPPYRVGDRLGQRSML